MVPCLITCWLLKLLICPENPGTEGSQGPAAAARTGFLFLDYNSHHLSLINQSPRPPPADPTRQSRWPPSAAIAAKDTRAQRRPPPPTSPNPKSLSNLPAKSRADWGFRRLQLDSRVFWEQARYRGENNEEPWEREGEESYGRRLVRMGQEKEEEEGLIWGGGGSRTHLTSLGDSDGFASPPAASTLHSVQWWRTPT
jgi:hypothetical protein